MPDLVGERIGNYRVARLIKKGGMGAVYLAEHPEIGRKVAIKVMYRSLDEESRDAERFLFEARAAANIDHPNVIDIYDFGRLDDGRPYLVMELLTGHELEGLIHQRGKMSAAEVLPYLQQICAGLQAAHNAGIVHRDLKPENVFVLERKPLAIRLLDFGIAKTQTWSGASLTGTGKIVGTPLVIAPEQAACESAAISPQTDLYSLGVILFWLLAGEPPFPRDSPVVLVARHILAPPRPLLEVAPTVPDGVAALVDQCLEKAPADRPATANEVVGRFATALDREPEELPVVPWEEARTGELWVAKPPAAGEPGEAAEQDSTTVGASSASTSAVTSAVTRRHAPAAGHGTDLDVPGLDTAFKEASEERPPEAALTTAADTARGARTPARRSWHLAALVLLVAVGAVLVAMAAKNDPAPQAPDGAVAPADAAVPDAALAPAPDSRPAPDARIDRAPELRAQQAPRRPGGRKVPRPPRRPGARKDRCSESRVGESTMNPFGKACPKPGK